MPSLSYLISPIRTIGGGGSEGLEQTLTISNTTGSQQTNVPVSFGVVAPDGTYAVGQIPELRKDGSAVIYQQIDQEKYWPSGSLRHCIVHTILPTHFTADASNLYEIHKKNGSQSHTAGISWTDILAYDSAAFNWIWSVDLDDGATWEADIRAADNGGVINGHSLTGPSNYGFHNKGPVCCEWRVEMPLRRTSDSANHPILRGEFHVRVYKDTAIRDIRVDCFINNGRAASENGNYLIKNIYLMKNGQNRASATWKREAVAPATTLTVTGGDLTNGQVDWTATAGSSVFVTTQRGRPIVALTGKGVLYPVTFTSGTVLQTKALFAQVSICNVQNGSAGSLSLNGAIVNGGVAKMQAIGGRYQRVMLYSANNNSGSTFTINGTTSIGVENEVLTGPGAGATVYATKNWITITSITYTGTPSQIMVGNGGFDKTAAITSGNWEIWAHVMWDGARLRQTVLHSTGRPARYVPKYDKTKLNLSRTFPKYSFTKLGSQASNVAASIAFNNALPSVGSWGDTLDYNPFYFNGWSGNDHKIMYGHLLREPEAGERDELGILSQWSMNWLEQQTNDAYRALLEHETGILCYPVHYIDDNTGHPVAPLDRPSYTGNDIIFKMEMPDAADTDFSGTATSFNPWNKDVAHRGEWGFTGYMVTGDLCYTQALQAMAISEWLAPSASFGTGYDRDIIEAGIQTRSMAWQLRGIIYAVAATPDTLHNAVCLARAVPKGILDGVMDIAESQWVNPGPDPDGFYSDAVANTPTKGDFHFVNAGVDGTQYAFYQHHYALTGLGAGVRMQVMNANGITFAEWFGQTSVNLVTNTTAINPRYVGPQYWIKRHLPGDPFDLAQMWSWHKDPANRPTSYVPHGGFNSIHFGDTVTVTGTATGVGNSITLTYSTPRFYTDHVGAYVLKMNGSSDGATVLGRAHITSVTNSTTIVCTVDVAFDNSNSFANSRVGLPDVGPNLAGVIRPFRGVSYDNNYMSYWATGLAVASAFPNVGAAAAAAFTTLEGLLNATVSDGGFSWTTYPRALLDPY